MLSDVVEKRTLAIEQSDLTYILIDHQVRLQFGKVEIVIEGPFVLTVATRGGLNTPSGERRRDDEEKKSLPIHQSAAHVFAARWLR